MTARVSTVAFQGVEVQPIDVQVQIAGGLPAFTIVGLPDKAVAESRERVRSALHAMGLALPAKRVIVNLAPADVAKEGSHFDLPIALGLLAAMEVIPQDALQDYIALGELGLDSALRPVAGVLPASMHAQGADKGIIVPRECGGEAAWAGDLDILAPSGLLALLNHLKGTQVLSRPRARLREDDAPRFPDLSEVKGQESARRALEIAAAGGHNMLMIGPPGAGKSMLASCMPGIMPPLSPKEALEVSMIHSLAGTLPEGGLLKYRPFRDPHNSASQPALIGGGQKARPGEISLAHNGVLFLDELPEFQRNTLEALRQPLETGKTLISRANHHAQYPARFQLVAAMNPCRCGYLGDPELECTKAPRCAGDYQSRISGPLMDRIDIQIDVPAVSMRDLSAGGNAESSAQVADRVARARERQKLRYAELVSDEPEAGVEARADNEPKLNAFATGRVLEDVARLSDPGRDMLNDAADKMKLSARAYHRILRVALTIADMDESDTGITSSHLAEALSYRRLRTN